MRVADTLPPDSDAGQRALGAGGNQLPEAGLPRGSAVSQQARQAGPNPAGNPVGHGTFLGAQLAEASVEGRRHGLSVGSAIGSQPAEPKVTPLAGGKPDGMARDVAQRDPGLLRGQELRQPGLEGKDAAGGEPLVVALNSGLQRFKGREREHPRLAEL